MKCIKYSRIEQLSLYCSVHSLLVAELADAKMLNVNLEDL